MLPEYESLLASNIEIPTRIKDSIKLVYVQLFRFFQSVVRVFTKKDGSSRNTAVIVGSLMWKPYDSRFDGLLKSLDLHSRLVRDEILIAGSTAAQQAVSSLEAIQAELKLEWEKAESERVAARAERDSGSRFCKGYTLHHFLSPLFSLEI